MKAKLKHARFGINKHFALITCFHIIQLDAKRKLSNLDPLTLMNGSMSTHGKKVDDHIDNVELIYPH